jgi:hypothetical protein
MTQRALLGCKRILPPAVKGGWMVLGLLLLVAALVTPSAQAQNLGSSIEAWWFSRVIDPQAVAYGSTYSEWSAEWWQWAGSIPAAEHPLFDHADCSQGQAGPVWFLGGKFCAAGDTCSFTGVVRSCNVPLGKALFFPIFNGEDNPVEENLAENPGNPAFQLIAAMRKVESDGLDGVTSVSCSLDGVEIPHLKERFRVQSPTFAFTVPADNFLAALYGNSAFAAGTYFPSVADGWYVMLPPLRPGNHVIHFKGVAGSFQLEVTYNLHVGH